MKSASIAIAACLASAVHALSVKFSQAQSTGAPLSGPNSSWKTFAAVANDTVDLTSSRDLIYIAPVNVAGTDYLVQLDTGSSDLWVHTANGVPNAATTGLTYNLTYGIGFAYGNIVTAAVDFAGFTIPRQALVDAVNADNPVLSLGAVGVLGLGFTSLSNIAAAVSNSGASFGASLLFNVFAQDPSVPNFVSFLLSRNKDPQAPAEGSFTISEYDPAYTAISGTPKIPTFPVSNPLRWTVLLDSFAAGGKKFAVGSTVSGVPSGKAVILLDSGTTFTYAPETVVSAIFTGLPNAVFNTTLGQWVLPCDTEVDVSLFIGGTQLDLNPLDVVTPSANDPTTCVGSFIPQNLPVAAGQFDWLVGVNILRSMYSVYDFGDPVNGSPANPFVQLLQLESAADMSADFHSIRGGTPTNGTTNASPTDGGSTVSADQSAAAAASNQSLADNINKVLNYLPAILGVLGLNALILVALVVVGVGWLCRRRKPAPSARRRTSPTNGALQLSPLTTSGYRPVSTAGDRDTAYNRDTMYDPETASMHKSMRTISLSSGPPGGSGLPAGLAALQAGTGPSAPPGTLSPAAPTASHMAPQSPLLAPPAPRYDSSSLPHRQRGPDMGAPQYNSTTF